MSTELENAINKPEVESKDFSVILASGENVNYISNEEAEYQWAPTQAGGLLIYKKTKHNMFGVVIKDERVRMFADGQWLEVQMIEDE